MGSKLSRTVREHKATASPRAATSQQDQMQVDNRQEAHKKVQTDNGTTATSTSSHDCPASTTSAQDTDAMDIVQRPRRSTDSRSASILRDLEQLPSGVAEDRPLPIPQASRPQEPPPPPPSPQNCLICCTPCEGPEKKPAKALHPCSRCENAYCVPCLKNMFLEACKDLSRMPPRCCTQIPIHHIRPYLSSDEMNLFKSKYEEWGTPNPFYCPIARCSTFIPNHLLPQARTNSKGKERVDSGIGTPTKPTVSCPECAVKICINCRSLSHDGVCGVFDFGVDKETADLLQKWGYRKCPKCGQGVKRMYGCNHMQCRCGAHFCWGCMQGKDNCIGDCDDDDEEDYSDYEPDEEEEEEETAPIALAPPAWNLAHVFPHMSQTREPTESLEPTASQPPNDTMADSTISTPRVRNLDGGSGAYWADQDLDFGDEPTDDYQDRSWDCYHDFGTARIKMKDAFRHDAQNYQMECMKCWATVHPEVVMPASARGGKSKITTAVSSASRAIRIPSRRRTGMTQHARRRAMGSLRGTQSMDHLEATASPLSSSPASFSSAVIYRDSPQVERQQAFDGSAAARVVDLYGNTIATAKEGNADEHMPDLDQVGEDKSGLNFATNSTPFSFAYECYECGLLVCHRCKDALPGHQVEVYVEGDTAEDEHKGDEETRNVAGDEGGAGSTAHGPEVDADEGPENSKMVLE